MSVPAALGRSFGSEITTIAESWGDGRFSVGDLSAPVGAGLSYLGLFLDPVNWVVGKLLEPIYNWIFENIGPLREAIHMVTGNPDAVTAYGDQFKDTSRRISDGAQRVVTLANDLLQHWEGAARDAFREAVSRAVEMQRGMADAQHKVAEVVYGLASIVSAVKEIVVGLIKDLITELVTKGVMAAAAAIPSLGSAIAAYMSWAAAKYALVMGRVARGLQKAFSRAAEAVGRASKLGRLFDDIAEQLGKLVARFDGIAERAQDVRDSRSQARAHEGREAERRQRAQDHYDQAEELRSRAARTERRRGDTQIRKAEEQAEKAAARHRDAARQGGDIDAAPKPWTKGVDGTTAGDQHWGRGDHDNPADDIGQVIE